MSDKRAATFHGLTPAEIEADVQAKGNDRTQPPYVVEGDTAQVGHGFTCDPACGCRGNAIPSATELLAQIAALTAAQVHPVVDANVREVLGDALMSGWVTPNDPEDPAWFSTSRAGTAILDAGFLLPSRTNFAAWLYREHVTASGNPQPAWESIDQDVWLRRADEGIAVLGGAA